MNQSRCVTQRMTWRGENEDRGGEGEMSFGRASSSRAMWVENLQEEYWRRALDLQELQMSHSLHLPAY